MANELTLSLTAQETNKGSISGKGTISFKIDLTDIRFNVDYRKEDRLIFNLAATQGLKISTKGTLTFSGDLSRDLINRSWDGSVKIQLDIQKTVSASLQHSFDPKKKSIRFDLKINL